MRIGFETNYDVGDIVYFMYENKPHKGVVTRVKFEAETDLRSDGTKTRKILEGLLLYGPIKQEQTLLYSVIVHDMNNCFKCHPGGYFYESSLFKTKKELVSSL